MTGPVGRLYRTSPAQQRALDLVPAWLHRLGAKAALTSEQLIGLYIWFAGSPVVAVVAWVVFGRATGVVMGTALACGPVALLLRWSRRRRERFVTSLPALVESVSRSLRSGASFVQALSEAAPDAPLILQPELRTVLDEMDSGQPTWEALQRWTTRRPEPEIRIVAAGLAVASENEAGASQALEGVGQSLRDRAALADEIRSQTAQATASMQAMVFLPLGFLLIDALGKKRTVRYLAYEPLGRVCLIAGTILVAIGWLWMNSIVRRRLPA